ncbi:migration and invasion-inhibitory protein isoform X2 [Cinclus cinclus]
MDLELLKRLRQANEHLLQRLRMKQEEIRKEFPSKQLLPASLHSSTDADRCVPSPGRVKENQVNAVRSTADPEIMVLVGPRTGPALSSSVKHSSSDRGVHQQQVKTQEGAGFAYSCPGEDKNVTPVSAVIMCGREVSRVDGDGHAQGSPEKKSSFLGQGEIRKQSALLHEKSHLGPSLNRVQNQESSEQHVVIREPHIPKSILLTSQSKELKKEASHVTFQPEPEEDGIPASSWSAHPFLGYDWIAGLLDTECSVTEKPEQYFAELQEFRQSNRESCIHQQHLEPRALDPQDLDLVTGSHKSVYCYRLNQRLFTIPVDSESACPVCKIPCTHQPPGTLEEPAYVRVSIPRSALLPAYKYRAHRRRSFEAADDLALPSHCLAGWENMVPSSKALLSSLDLRASLEEKASPYPCLDSVSRVSGEAKTDKFLHLPHLAQLRFSTANWNTRQQLKVQTPLPQHSAPLT